MRKFPKKPSLRFFYSEELHAKTLKLLDALEQAEDPKKYRDALGDFVVELTDARMDYYFSQAAPVGRGGLCGTTVSEPRHGRGTKDNRLGDP